MQEKKYFEEHARLKFSTNLSKWLKSTYPEFGKGDSYHFVSEQVDIATKALGTQNKVALSHAIAAAWLISDNPFISKSQTNTPPTSPVLFAKELHKQARKSVGV